MTQWLLDEFEAPPADAIDMGSPVRYKRADHFPITLYGSMAIALALKTPFEQIAREHHTTITVISQLLATHAMKLALRDAMTQIKTHGTTGGFILRNRYMAEDLLNKVYDIAKDPKTDASLVFKIFESAAKNGGVDPSSTKKAAEQGPAVSVTFNLGAGVPGIEHVLRQSMPKVEVLER
jgi:hypothetical protein